MLYIGFGTIVYGSEVLGIYSHHCVILYDENGVLKSTLSAFDGFSISCAGSTKCDTLKYSQVCNVSTNNVNQRLCTMPFLFVYEWRALYQSLAFHDCMPSPPPPSACGQVARWL